MLRLLFAEIYDPPKSSISVVPDISALAPPAAASHSIDDAAVSLTTPSSRPTGATVDDGEVVIDMVTSTDDGAVDVHAHVHALFRSESGRNAFIRVSASCMLRHCYEIISRRDRPGGLQSPAFHAGGTFVCHACGCACLFRARFWSMPYGENLPCGDTVLGLCSTC